MRGLGLGFRGYEDLSICLSIYLCEDGTDAMRQVEIGGCVMGALKVWLWGFI